jgi:hypothetical protein
MLVVLRRNLLGVPAGAGTDKGEHRTSRQRAPGSMAAL